MDKRDTTKVIIVKKDATINIGSTGGGPDRIISLVKDKELPKIIEEKFYAVLKEDKVI